MIGARLGDAAAEDVAGADDRHECPCTGVIERVGDRRGDNDDQASIAQNSVVSGAHFVSSCARLCVRRLI